MMDKEICIEVCDWSGMETIQFAIDGHQRFEEINFVIDDGLVYIKYLYEYV